MTVAVSAPGPGFGCWAGAPSAAPDCDWAVLLAYRLHGVERRGAQVVLARADDGERFETVGALDEHRCGAESLERRYYEAPVPDGSHELRSEVIAR